MTPKDCRLRLGDYRDTLTHIKADLIFTSPPYNIGSKGPRNDKMRRRGLRPSYSHKSFRAITDYPDALPEPVYQDEQAQFLIWAADHLVPGGTLVYNHKPRQRNKTVIDPHEWMRRPEVRERIVEATVPITWDRGSTHNTGRGQLWQRTEYLYIMRRAQDTGWRMDNYRGRHGLGAEWQGDLWKVPLNIFGNGHNAAFRLPLALAVIKMWSEPGDLVCDPYMGSGTTALAATQLGRRFDGAEILPRYYAMARASLETAA